MDVALLVLRLVAGLLFIGHGLQKLLPPRLSPPLLHAHGPRAAAAGFSRLGLEPALPLALLTGATEVAGGFLIASGLLTPLGTALLAAVMTVAILTVHLHNGIWSAEGGFELNLVLLTSVFVVSALGPGRLSIDAWAGIDDWAGVRWASSDAVRAGVAVGIGAAAGLLTLALAHLARAARRARHVPSTSPRRAT